jgi:hypothetical protein
MHIQKKCDHFKNRIKTPEDFIEYAATKNSISGELYVVRCDDREMRNDEWLKRERHRLRNR